MELCSAAIFLLWIYINWAIIWENGLVSVIENKTVVSN